ncbi:MAG TPA: response regulator [Chthoniobacterales bacterium]|nr:response regulator [Chthoniobacterales bacterium]
MSVDVPTKTRILVAEDDPISRVLVVSWLQKWGYDVIATHDGAEAMKILRQPDAPAIAILDWCMPEMDGLEVCRRLRDSKKTVYLILLTARSQKEDMIEGLRAGADDYVVKPFHAEELHARLLAGLRVMTVQENLAARIAKLEATSGNLQALRLQIPL